MDEELYEMDEELEEEVEERGGWAANAEGGTVFVETGRGSSVEVNVGEDFVSTVDRIATQANYGGYYRVFLNGDELLDPSEAPEKILPTHRIAITSYDKVG